MTESDCPLCRKVGANPPIEDEVVWNFPHSVAYLGPWQFYPGYCVLVARRHATELSRLPDLERSAFLEEMCLLARAVETAMSPDKLNYELLGNLVPHLHWHVFPRRKTDPEHLKPVWLALDRAEHDPAEKTRLETGPQPRTTTVTALRTALAALKAPSV